MTIRKLVLPLLTAASLSTAPAGMADDNDTLTDTINALIGPHNVALPISMTPAPGISDAAFAITYSTNIALKYIRAPFSAPQDVGVMPNSPDQCSFTMTLPQTEADYSNLLGIWDVTSLTTDWGPLGAPSVAHANTDVTVKVSDLGSGLLEFSDMPQTIVLPAGNHNFQWQAETQISPLFDIYIPLIFYGLDQIKYGKSITSVADDSAEQAARQATFQDDVLDFLGEVAIEAGLTTIDQLTDTEEPTVTHGDSEHIQRLSVFDVRDPLISTPQPIITLEATDFGGVNYQRVKEQLFDTIIASDPCGRPYTLSSNAPTHLPLGATTLTWTVRDRGPSPTYGVNEATLQQSVIVEDTQAPIMVAPPGKVIEAWGTGVDQDQISLGIPLVVDLADPKPIISNDSPEFFQQNSRTEVVWTATDASSNATSAVQLITIKQPGSNTAPEADSKSASTLTAKPVDIVLTGTDFDVIDGRTDPLHFRIVQPPQNGEFIAPLYPYFIEDYRTKPEGPFGEEFLTASPRSKWVFENYCSPENISWEAVFEPIYMHVSDDGTQYIFDYYWTCNVSSSVGQTRPRVSKWDKDGNYLGQASMNSNTNEQFVLDRDGHIYFTDRVGSGSSTDLFLKRCSTDFGTNSTQCDTSWKFNSSSAPLLSPGSLVYARVDSQRGIAFVTDKRRVFAFDIRGGGGDSVYLGALMGGEQFLTSCSAVSSRSGFTIEIDSESNLYVADTCADKIHKFGPSVFTDTNQFVPGDYIGWLGKCDSSSNNACDDDKQRSKGYSCTDTTCFTDDSAGEKQGQFNTPLHLALDPNDILYVADYANKRVQRFAPDGSFAGEAVSTGTGINQGSEPGFILGNFDSPKTVSVNSSQIFIVDQAESFVHVFETSPLQDITDHSATVTYVSDFSFHSAQDSFTYRASDGLANSSPAQVTIDVARNYREPVAFAASFTGTEDGFVEIELTGDDPDGIIGTDDFNPLDVLTFEITEQPEHGSLLGGGANYIYQPNEDFYGNDSFAFVAQDGVLTSAPAIVDLEIEGINDPPRVVFAGPESGATGFSFNLLANFYDDNLKPELDEQHSVTINWGDGSSTSNGQLEAGGALVVAPVNEMAPGLITANHIYTTPGTRTVSLCIRDDLGAQRCESMQAAISNQVTLGMEVSASTEEVDVGEQIVYEVSVVNLEPAVASAAQTADSVTVTHEIPDGLNLIDYFSVGAQCTSAQRQLFCEPGNLSPGEDVEIFVVAANNGTLFQTLTDDFNVAAMTESPSTSEFYLGAALTTVIADQTDSDGDGISDGYELAYGLNHLVNDALDDLDGDGLSNLAEFQIGTMANNPDSDDDGITDGWEHEFGLDPLWEGDAELDSDEDGFNNRDEYLVDRNPLFDEQTGDQLVLTVAVFKGDILQVPAVQVGPDYLDLELELKGMMPVTFELADFHLRDIRIDVPGANVFDPATGTLNIPVASVVGNLYTLQFRLVSSSPIQLQLEYIGDVSND